MALTKVTGQVVNTSTDLTVGVLTATTATFTGNVSVGGTLTYEDVTNVDSVGLITARNGISVTGSNISVESSEDRLLYLKSTDANAYLTFEDTDSSSGFANRIGSVSDGLYFSTGGGGERARIDSSGNFGLGTASPTTKLEINGGTDNNIVRIVSTDANANIEFADNTTTSGCQIGANGDNLKFGISGTEKMRIDSSGRLLLGTTTEGDVNADNLTIADSGNCGMTIRSGASSFGSIFFSDGTSGAAEYQGQILYDHNNNYMRFLTGASERMRIDSSGNMGLGTNSPTADGLHIVNSTQPDLFMGTSANAEGFKIVYNDTDSVIGNVTSTPLRFVVGNSERGRIDSSGRLMLGTTTEGEAGADEFTVASSGDCGITIRSGSSDKGKILFSDATSGDGEHDGYIQYEQNNRVLRFGTATAERMRIDSSGNMGLGTNSPTSVLHIKSDTNNNVNNGFLFEAADSTHKIFRLYENGTGEAYSRWYYQDSAKVLIRTNGSSYFNGGNVGIKNTSPSSQYFNDLVIGDGSGDHGITLHTSTSGSSSIAFSDATSGSGRYAGYLQYDHSDNAMKFYTDGGNERMRILGGGDLVIGKTATNANGDGIELRGQGTSGQIVIGKTYSGTVNGIFFNHNSAYVGGLNYTNSGTSLVTSSDYRLKENIVAIPNAIARTKQLNPVQFNFITEPEETVEGFVAHELGQVIPEACYGEKDAVNEDGSVKPQTIAQEKIIPLLTAALQEAIAKIETLESQVAALQG